MPFQIDFQDFINNKLDPNVKKDLNLDPKPIQRNPVGNYTLWELPIIGGVMGGASSSLKVYDYEKNNDHVFRMDIKLPSQANVERELDRMATLFIEMGKANQPKPSLQHFILDHINPSEHWEYMLRKLMTNGYKKVTYGGIEYQLDSNNNVVPVKPPSQNANNGSVTATITPSGLGSAP